ncbi:hypothetical protein ACE6H2_010600 [Prunus campanulata]
MVSNEIYSETSAAEVEGYCASKLTVDSAVKYLQLANKLFSQDRVGFYGGQLDRKECVYREARDVWLGDIMEKLSHIYEYGMDGNHTLHIIPDSRQVNADGVCYLQITAVDSVMEDEDLGSRRERIFSLSTGSVCARVFERFLFDTPFT